MKKIIAFILVVFMSFGLCACGNKANDSKATLVTNEGQTVTMSMDELVSAYDSNEAKFKKLYCGAKITFTGTITNIKTNTNVIVKDGSVIASQNKIVFEEGWSLVISENNAKYDLADYEVGQVLEVTTSIVGAPYDTDFLKNVSDNNRVVWLVGNDEFYNGTHSNVETVIKIAN